MRVYGEIDAQKTIQISLALLFPWRAACGGSVLTARHILPLRTFAAFPLILAHQTNRISNHHTKMCTISYKQKAANNVRKQNRKNTKNSNKYY